MTTLRGNQNQRFRVPGLGLTCWVLGIAFVVSSYVASFGPAHSLAMRDYISPRLIHAVYYPLPRNVSMDAQGRAQIGGVAIGNTNVRDNAFKIMDKLDMKPKILVPITMTNAQQASNFIQVLESMNRAGLSREKKPNPYE